MNIDLTLLFLKIFISSASTGPPRPPVQSKVLTLSIFFILTAPLTEVLYISLWSGTQCRIGLIRPETCTVCDSFLYVTFTDFCRAVHQTKRTRS